MRTDLLFAQQFNKWLNERKALTIDSMTEVVLPPDEYANKVGYLRALKDIEVNFERLINTYFEETSKYG